MHDCFITFRSITRAQRGARLLDTVGIHQQLMRTPGVLAAQGCGYALRLSPASAAAAAEALRQNEIAYQKAYALDGDGQYREISL